MSFITICHHQAKAQRYLYGELCSSKWRTIDYSPSERFLPIFIDDIINIYIILILRYSFHSFLNVRGNILNHLYTTMINRSGYTVDFTFFCLFFRSFASRISHASVHQPFDWFIFQVLTVWGASILYRIVCLHLWWGIVHSLTSQCSSTCCMESINLAHKIELFHLCWDIVHFLTSKWDWFTYPLCAVVFWC